MNPLESGGREGEGRLSLWKLDRLIEGELPEAEASELRRAVETSPEAQRYLNSQANLKSDLALDWVRKRLRENPGERTRARAAGGRRNPRILIGDFFESFGSPKGGLALAFLAVLGVSVWTWQARESAPTFAGKDGSKYHSKGMDAPGIKLIVKGAEYETADLIPARSGDTLGFSYRSPFALRTQIWYREENGRPEAMMGPASILEWNAALGWKQPSDRVILEGDWKHQTLWIVWSKNAFTAEDARKALEDGSRSPELHAEAFRLARPD
jgi:hypothetical protein